MALVGCAASGEVNTGVAGTTAVSGGAIGATCPKEDQIGCAPGAKAKVRCKGAVWVDDGACPSGETCQETKSGDSVTATQCAILPTANTNRAIMCAKANHCLPVDFGDCMHPRTLAQMTKGASLMGILEPEDLLMLRLDAWQSCIAAAKDCGAVLKCAQDGALNCSSGQGAGTCSGSVAHYCQDTTALSVDCSLAGLPCATLTTKGQSMVFCGKLTPCTSPKTFSCAGNVAKVCEPIDAAQSVSIDINCGLLGATCSPTAKYDDDPDVCTFIGGAPCDSATYAESCAGTAAVECKGGKTRQMDCAALGGVCATYNTSDGKVNATCTDSPQCLGGAVLGSDAKVVTFCDGSAGYRSFDCALAGMEYGSFGCVFPSPVP